MADTFIKLSQSVEISTKDFKMIDHFIVLMYDWTFQHETVDKRRKYLPTQMNCTLYNCQPIRDALLQHVRRGMSQPDMWTHCMTLDKNYQNLPYSGWLVDDKGDQ